MKWHCSCLNPVGVIFTGLLFTAAFLGHALILSELFMAETSRDLFASRLGMLAATLGSSVGLGNIWKFPALTGEHGGASFLLVYPRWLWGFRS